MKKVGAIVDLAFSKHVLFRNYYFALLELYGEVKIVQNPSHLQGLDILFIAGQDHGPHISVYSIYGFISTINAEDITVVLISFEKIVDSHYPNHKMRVEILKKCNKFIHYVYDGDDCAHLGSKLLRVAISKNYKNCIDVPLDEKINEMVFCGMTYPRRLPILHGVRSFFPLTIKRANESRTWESYLRLLSRFRFVLSPLGDANGFTSRFYEALLVHSIPVQQVKKDTLKYYDIEAQFPDCIFFETLEDLKPKLAACTLPYSTSEIWMEDVLGKLLKEDNLL